MTGVFIKEPGRNHAAHDGTVKEFFGLKRKAKWPKAGMPITQIQGVTCWVEPLDTSRGFHLRAMCHCPECGFITAIGRLAQHAKTH